MPVRSYRKPATGFKTEDFLISYDNHKLPNGKIDTNTQGLLTYVRSQNVVNLPGFQYPGAPPFNGSDAVVARDQFPPTYFDTFGIRNRLIAAARGKLDAKLRHGKADLGVTLGSWRQSWDMIAKRGRQAATSLERVTRRLERDRHATGRIRAHRRIRDRNRDQSRFRGDNNYLETPANLVLEGEFGWLPLFADAANAFGVMTKPLPNGWVTGRARLAIFDSVESLGNPYTLQTWSGSAKCTIACNVRVDNPNLWLANMLGLLNAPGVAWDLVPWSFVVNMFTNLGQIANSFTSHYGLEFENISTTNSVEFLIEELKRYSGNGSPSRTNNLVKRKVREGGAIPSPPLIFRMPELNLELALIGVSLAIQQVSRITRLLR